jgi:hypothetical protein
MALRCTYRIFDYDAHVWRECGFVAETQASMKRHQDAHYSAYFPDSAREYEVVQSPRHPDTVQASLEGSV